MNLHMLKKAVSVKMSRAKKQFMRVAKSYVSLFLIVILAVVATTAWLKTKDNVNISLPEMILKSTSGIHDDSFQAKSSDVKIQNFRLEEASSVDGRNIYFPASIHEHVNDYTSPAVTTSKTNNYDELVVWDTTNSAIKTQTEDMRFREGNAGDKNARYAYASTDIYSSGGDTNVWIKGYKIQIGDITGGSYDVYEDKININNDYTQQIFPDPYTCPVRIAIIDDSGHTPKVFDPSARLKEYANNTYAVYWTDSEGKPQTQLTELDSFSSYYYGTNNPLFTIPAGEHINMTVVAWLEGTHPYAKNYSGKEMTVSIEVETNVTQMEEIYLHDWTIGDTATGVNKSNYVAAQTWSGQGGRWLTGNVNIAMQYYDTSAGAYKTTVMTELKGTNAGADANVTDSDVAHGINSATGKDANGSTVFKAAIPKYVSTDISFYRLSKVKKTVNGVESLEDVYPGTIFNSWHTKSGVNGRLTSTAQGWRVLGTLAEDRIINGTNYYVHYYAIRGNGENEVSHSASDRYQKWLRPCIGYWGTQNGPVDRST